MKKLISSLLFTLIINAVFAQEGAPLLTNFKESRDVENQNWAISQDSKHVMLFANRKGILAFDGQDWFSLRIPTIPFPLRLTLFQEKYMLAVITVMEFLKKILPVNTIIFLSQAIPQRLE